MYLQEVLQLTNTIAKRMYQAVARGGPRDGIRLTAPLDWDGRVMRPTKLSNGKPEGYYVGNYVFNVDTFTWDWYTVQPQFTPGRHAV